MKEIIERKGCVVTGLGNNGRRYNTNVPKSSNWGGKRKKSFVRPEQHWLHPDACDCPKAMINESLVKVERSAIDDTVRKVMAELLKKIVTKSKNEEF